MRSEGKRPAVLLAVAFALLCFTTGQPWSALDAAHVKYFEGSRHDAEITEWWYFAYVCPSNTTGSLSVEKAGIFFLGVVNPENKLDLGLSVVYSGQYARQLEERGEQSYERGTVTAQEGFRASDFRASYDRADVSIANTAFLSADPSEPEMRLDGSSACGHDCRIHGGLPVFDNHNTKWNVTFRADQSSAPMFIDRNVTSTSEPWMALNWLVFMPRSRVDGTVAVGDSQLSLDGCLGYHDHNFGRWPLTGVDWHWMQGNSIDNDDPMTFVYSETPKSNAFNDYGQLVLDFRGERYTFNNTQWTVSHSDWQRDLAFKFPAKGQLTAQAKCQEVAHSPKHCASLRNGDETLSFLLTWVVEKSFLLVNPVAVLEQPAVFEATFTRGGEKVQKPLLGFTEWTDKWL